MIDVYFWPTPNGYKVTMMLEELGLEYKVIPVNIGKGDQFAPEFLKISPNNRMPAIIDHEGPGGEPFPIFESGAILMYLGEKYGKFFPKDTARRYEVVQWLMWQMGGVGPNFGQAHHFRRAAKEKVPYAIQRFTEETRRLWGVLDARLKDHQWVAAGEYTIADMALFPWCLRYDWQGVKLEEFPNARRWFEAVMARPAVKRGLELPKAP